MHTESVNYDMLSICLNNGLSFVAYTLPNENHFQIISQKHTQLKHTEFSKLENGFIFHPFQINHQSPLIFITDDFHYREGDEAKDFIAYINSIKQCEKKSLEVQPEINKDEYLKVFKKFHKAICNKDYTKIVLSRIKNISCPSKFDFIQLFRELNIKYVSAFNYILYTPDSGLWLGASPELLFNYNSDIAEVVALAGTKSIDDPTDWEEKEKLEQQFVVDYIHETLLNQGIKNISSTKSTLKAGQVKHIKTSFKFPLREVSNKAMLIKDLHPTPAVCGLPKKEAYNFITKNEIHQRFYYTGFLGPVNRNAQTQLFVNLRCLSYTPKTISLYLGGGITSASEDEKEWAETELKATTLLSLIKNQMNASK